MLALDTHVPGERWEHSEAWSFMLTLASVINGLKLTRLTPNLAALIWWSCLRKKKMPETDKELTPKSFTALVTTSAAALFMSSTDTLSFSQDCRWLWMSVFFPRQHLVIQHVHKTACGAQCKQISVFDLAHTTVFLFKDHLYTKLSNE